MFKQRHKAFLLTFICSSLFAEELNLELESSKNEKKQTSVVKDALYITSGIGCLLGAYLLYPEFAQALHRLSTPIAPQGEKPCRPAFTAYKNGTQVRVPRPRKQAQPNLFKKRFEVAGLGATTALLSRLGVSLLFRGLHIIE